MSDEHKPLTKISKIKLDREACISVGSCEAISPDVFGLDEEGLVYLKDIEADSPENILDAAKSCPVNAIYVYDQDGDRIWPKQD